MTTRFAIPHRAAFLLALTALGCQPLTPEIPIEDRDPATLDEVAAAAGLTQMPWQPVRIHEGTGATVASARVVEDLVFLQDSADTVHAIDLATGTHRWVLNLGGPLSRPPIVGRDRVGFLTRHNHLTVAMRDSGNRLLDRALDFTPSAPSVIAGDTLFTGSWGDVYRVRTVSLLDGWPGWSFPLGAPLTAGLLRVGQGADEMIYAATLDGDVLALPARPATSAPPSAANWRYRTLGRNSANLVADDTRVYVASEDRALYAIERLVGAVQWKWFADAPLTEAPAVAATRIYQHVPGAVVAIDKATGEALYRLNGARTFLSTVDGLDWHAADDGTLMAVDFTTGAEVRRIRSPLFGEFVPNPLGNALLFTNGTELFALR